MQERWTALAEPASVGRLRNAVTAFAAAAGAGARTVADVKLAVSEALTNAVVHGYQGREVGEVHVLATVAGGQLVVVVEDAGGGLVPRPDSPGIGIGLPLITMMAASADIGPRDGGGTVVRMTFPC